MSVWVVATGARKERKFNPALGGGALLDIGIYNLGFLRIVTGNEPQNVETQKYILMSMEQMITAVSN